MENISKERGIIKIKPIFIGIYHYNINYGSVCSPDKKGTPPVKEISYEDLEEKAKKMIDYFESKLEGNFVRIEEPYIISKHVDLRFLAKHLTYDVDAFLIGKIGNVPLIIKRLEMFGLPLLYKPDNVFLKALSVKKYLRESKFLYIGEIPSFSAPRGPWDFFRIQEKFGIAFKHIDSGEFFKVFDSFDDEVVERELKIWKNDFGTVLEPSERDLMDMTRIYLTLKYFLDREDANAVTINCGRFTEIRPIVPCMAFNRLIDEGYVCGCEGDITALLSSLILHAVSRGATTMGNFGYRPGMFEAREDEVTIEHDIIPLSMSVNKYTIRDYHGRKFGVTGYAPIKSNQPVTMFNIDPSLEEATVIEGYTKESFDGIHCRIIVRIDVKGDVKKIPEILVGSQHMSMTYGHWLEELKEVGKILGIKIRAL